ncbi:homoserine dehydrogenase [Chloroflexota bacterium]
MEKKSIGIGLLGLGVIAGGVARVLLEKGAILSEKIGCPVILRRIKVLEEDLNRAQAKEMDASLFTTDTDEFFNEPNIDIIIEAIGGEEPAFEYLSRAITSGKYVVTSNKEVVAKHGAELRDLAQQHGVGLRYEASVGGGIPLIAPFKEVLVANKITGIYAIINGTTNYILTKMSREGLEFSAALKQAQELGYAEANPENDIDGIDARYKIAILASLAFQTDMKLNDIHYEGISRLTSRDFKYAQELGYAIKLLAIAKQDNKYVEARVHPVFLPQDSLLAKVDGVYNGVLVEGDLIGKVLFYGEGAGPSPTSSAVIADVVASAKDIIAGVCERTGWEADSDKEVRPISDIEIQYYLRMSIHDQSGVLAQIAKVLGDHQISISSAIQKLTDNVAQTAEIVIVTHPAQEKAMQLALSDLAALTVVKEISNFIRVEA